MAKAEEYEFDFKTIYESLDPIIDSGIQYYTDKDGDVDTKFFKLFERAKKILELVRPLEESLSKTVDVFDFVYPDGKQVKGSGFRSLLYVYHSALTSFQQVFEHWSKRHGGWLYVATEHLDNMRAHVRVVDGVHLLLKYAVILAEQRVAERTVFSDGEIATVLKKLAISDEVERDCFYGRCLGFQVSSSVVIYLHYMLMYCLQSKLCIIILGLLSVRHMEAFYSMCYNLVVSGIVLASTCRQCILKLSYHSLIASGIFIPGCFCAQANFIELQHSSSLVLYHIIMAVILNG